MPMMMKIEPRWEALEPAPDKPIFQLLDSDHPLKLYIGRAVTGGYLFLLLDPEQPPKLKNLKSVHIDSMQRSDGQWSLLLSLNNIELASVFALLCEDLVESSRHLVRGGSGIKLISRRLANWRRLLEEGGNGLLSNPEVRGLIGELFMLDSFLIEKLGSIDAVNSWCGPFGSDQDFQMTEEAWEIKTIHTDSVSVQIASEMQLYSLVRKINLVVISLDEVTDSSEHSLNGLVSRIKLRMQDQPMAQDAFDERLVTLGYLARAEYDSPHFKAGKVRTFRVEDNFPRLQVKDLIFGVTNVRYKVLLEACTPFEIETPFKI